MLGLGAMEYLCCHHAGDQGCPAGETMWMKTEVPQPTTSHVNKAILDHPAQASRQMTTTQARTAELASWVQPKWQTPEQINDYGFKPLPLGWLVVQQ